MTPNPSREQLVRQLGVAWAALPVPEEADALNQRFLTRLGSGAGTAVLLAPGGAGLVGFGLAGSPRKLLELREQLLAFVGPSHAWFPGPLHSLQESELLEGRLRSLFWPQCVRFESPAAPGLTAALLEALGRLYAVLERAPALAPEEELGVHGSCRGFYLALRALDGAEAERQFAALDQSADLSEANLLALRVELLATFQAWRELLGLPELERLTVTRQTPALAQAVLRAFYQERLTRHEAVGRFDLALEVFRTEVLPTCSMLLAVRAGMDHPDSRRLFAYRAVLEHDGALGNALLAEAGTTEERAGLEQLFAALSASPVPPAPAQAAPSLELARAAYEDGDVDEAFALLSNLSASFDRSALLLLWAQVMGTLAACELALRAFQELTETDRQRLLRVPHLRIAHAQLEERLARSAQATVPSLPRDWPELFARLDQPGNLDLVKVAQQAASEWSVQGLSLGEIQQLADHLERERPDEQRRLLLDILPHFLGAVQQTSAGHETRFRRLYQSLLTTLLIEHRGNLQALQLIRDLVQRLLEQGLDDATEYGQLANDLVQVWQDAPAPRALEWLLELAELLADYPSPAPAERERLVRVFPALSPEMLRRLRPADWEVFEDVCGLLGLRAEYEACRGVVPAAEAEAEADEVDFWAQLAGLRVGIYSLEEPSARRAGDKIREHCPDCNVALNHDYVATESLRELARTSDIVVMVVRAAQHAATDGIQQERPGRPTLRPTGKGASSILTALEQHLRVTATVGE